MGRQTFGHGFGAEKKVGDPLRSPDPKDSAVKSGKTGLKNQNIAKIDNMSSTRLPALSKNQKIRLKKASAREKYPTKKCS
tara:strand:- start:61 stop:300 length:240 start_codon:yes stop_codon:yes gene_type:complete